MELKHVVSYLSLWEAASCPKSKLAEEVPCHRVEGLNRIPESGKQREGDKV